MELGDAAGDDGASARRGSQQIVQPGSGGQPLLGRTFVRAPQGELPLVEPLERPASAGPQRLEIRCAIVRHTWIVPPAGIGATNPPRPWDLEFGIWSLGFT